MKKCKITVLRKTFQKDLAEEYGIDGLTTCPMQTENLQQKSMYAAIIQ